jgi:histidinol-phosphate aminotransferase
MKIHGSAKKSLAHIHSYIPGKPVEEVEREYGVKNAIKMASNENALGPSPKALRAIQKSLKKVHRYPDGSCYYLRKKLSKKLSVLSGELLFGNGSDEILVLVVRAFVGRGDEVIIADPTFLVYEIATQAECGKIIKVPVKNFHYDLDSMRKKISARTKLIFIANPDNPIGTYVNKAQLAAFMRRVPKDVIVVLDEAYYEFGRMKNDYPNSLALLKKYRNLLVIRTFSKVYGLAGLRIGYAIADREVIAALNKVREPFNVNLLAQEAALAALEDKIHLKKTIDLIRDERRYLYQVFNQLKLKYVDTATNFILVDIRKDAKLIHEKLLKKGVIVRPMNVWGLNTFIRVTLGRHPENIRFVNELKKILEDNK